MLIDIYLDFRQEMKGIVLDFYHHILNLQLDTPE